MALPASRGPRVRFENVTFGYAHDRAVLSNVSLEALPGQTVALVGPTGAGKSTLVSLLPRFFDPWQVRVTIEDTDVREVQLAGLRDQIAFVLQEPFLLPLSIADNIAYGRPDVGRDRIIAAAVAANADEFVPKALKATGVLVVPGGGFGDSLKNGVRISFGPLVRDTAKIDEGLARLGAWMRGT